MAEPETAENHSKEALIVVTTIHYIITSYNKEISQASIQLCITQKNILLYVHVHIYNNARLHHIPASLSKPRSQDVDNCSIRLADKA